MKFVSKKHQEILEVLHYEDGPCLYGFEQDCKSFLAYLKKTNSDDSQTWLLFPLENSDKHSYEQMKDGKISLSDFVKDKGAFEVTFDYTGLSLKETWLSKVDSSSIISYAVTY